MAVVVVVVVVVVEVVVVVVVVEGCCGWRGAQVGRESETHWGQIAQEVGQSRTDSDWTLPVMKSRKGPKGVYLKHVTEN